MRSAEKEEFPTHEWRFFRAGEFDQAMLERGSDLLALSLLDKKLWAALSCPVHGLELDSRTLSLIDSDSDGRIRVPEILEAIAFCARHMKSLDPLLTGGSAFSLEQLDTTCAEGAELAAAARYLLTTQDRGNAPFVTIEEIAAAQAQLDKLDFNGDGVVPPAAAPEGAVRDAMATIIAVAGGELDRSGEAGVSTASLERFYHDLTIALAWLDETQQQSDSILPLAEATAQAYAALQEVRQKIDDYFVRCRLAAFDARAAAPLNRNAADYEALASQALSLHDTALAAFPLASVSALQPLPLGTALNPAWSEPVRRFCEQVVVPLLGARGALNEAEWQAMVARFAPYEAWQARKPAGSVVELGAARLRELQTGGSREAISGLIAADIAVAPRREALERLERLVRYVRDLMTLLRNFVNFADFYNYGGKAIFQAGTLYLDQRSCDLCLRVDDIAKHAALANLSRTYLVYCECRRRGGTERMNIAAAITGGDADGLMVGRNGLFYDRAGADWDATVVRIVEHSISIRQAFSDPYKRLARFIGAQLEKMASARAKQVDEKLAGGVAAASGSVESGKGTQAPFDVAKFAGIFAAIGLALGAIGTAVAAIITGLLALPWWQLPLAIGGAVLAISGPSMVLAWLKLKQRNLAPLLDANGWAVNSRARINIPFGASLTSLAKLPPGTPRPLRDPFAERRPLGWFSLVGVSLVAAGLLYWLWLRGLLG